MKDLLNGIFYWILKYLIIITTTIILVLSGVLLFSISHVAVTGYKSYLIYSISTTSVISIMLLIASIIGMIILNLSNKLFKKNSINNEVNSVRQEHYLSDDDNKFLNYLIKADKSFNVFLKSKSLKIFYSIIIIFIIIYSYNDYYVVTEDKIIEKNLFSNKTYSYDEVEKIKTGITPGRDVNLYYELIMKDGTDLNLLSGVVDTKDSKYEDVIYNIDNKLINNGTEKEIDYTNVGEFKKQGYDGGYVDKVLRLLNLQ